MIDAVFFDLDGTLVQTEALKALSYAKAAIKLDPDLTEDQVIESFKEVVGLPRKQVAEKLLQMFDLENVASEKIEELNVDKPWQVLVALRMENYFAMISDSDILKKQLCPYNLELLKWFKKENYPLGLATMSERREAFRVLDVLGMKSYFSFIATIQDVEHGKPDPEIYGLLASEFEVESSRCLVIEDSANGVKAALAAEMSCIVVTTEYTREGVHKLPSYDQLVVVDNPENLLDVAKDFVNHN